MSKEKSPFKKIAVKKTLPTDIEALFKELKNRSPDVRDLFAHQADILREYQSAHISSTDVSLELPTGSGKTLVGLLIAEYRRRVIKERVLYLCPTRQLVNQVAKHAKDYGIDARVFVGSKRTYNKRDEALYRSGDIIAISTYSGLFNVSPGLYDPQTIILDDAHSAETYIASMWSVNISRIDNEKLYSDILQLFEKDLPVQLVDDLRSQKKTRASARSEKIPFGAFFQHLPALRELLTNEIPNPDESDLYFAWSVIRDGLHACHVYISWDAILIRPYIPPTLTHRPFATANQRVYMSATLGQGGELERITGIRKVSRIPTPKTYTYHGVGRRLFLFPDRIKDSKDYAPWLSKLVADSKRTLALCPTTFQAGDLKQIMSLDGPPPRILGSRDIEDSLATFTGARHAVLLLTNRYDGIDLPNEACRLLVLYGLPSKTNLQEAFLEERLGLEVLLRDRIRTRIVQGTGRCTRSDNDYAAVVMAGRRLLDFCLRKENIDSFHPEIRAEMRFVLEQPVTDLSGFDDMLRSFYGRDEAWAGAEVNITELRSASSLPDSQTTRILAFVAEDEVDFAYALWRSDYESAVMHGRKIVDSLSGTALAPYRALWCYFVAAASYPLSKKKTEYRKLPRDFLRRATEACSTVSWFTYALRSMEEGTNIATIASEAQALAVEAVEQVLLELGSVGPQFGNKMSEIEGLLSATDSKKFDSGLLELGKLLGFDSWRPEDEAAPDCIWQLGDQVFLLEGKSEESVQDGIPVDDCRQAAGHIKWARANQRTKSLQNAFSILVSPRSRLEPAAVAFAADIYLWPITSVREMFGKVKLLFTDLRNTMTSVPSEQFRDTILERLIATELLPESVLSGLTSRPLAKQPVKNKK